MPMEIVIYDQISSSRTVPMYRLNIQTDHQHFLLYHLFRCMCRRVFVLHPWFRSISGYFLRSPRFILAVHFSVWCLSRRLFSDVRLFLLHLMVTSPEDSPLLLPFCSILLLKILLRPVKRSLSFRRLLSSPFFSSFFCLDWFLPFTFSSSGVWRTTKTIWDDGEKKFHDWREEKEGKDWLTTKKERRMEKMKNQKERAMVPEKSLFFSSWFSRSLSDFSFSWSDLCFLVSGNNKLETGARSESSFR